MDKINTEAIKEKTKAAMSVAKKHRLIVRSFTCGAIAVIGPDMILLYVLAYVIGVWYLYASVIAYITSVLMSFFLQKFWAFKDSSLEGVHGQFAMFVGVVILDVFLNTSLVFFLVEFLNSWYVLAQVLSASFIGALNFIVYSAIVFRRYKPGDKPRILIAAGIFPPDIGGPAIHTFQFVKEFTKAGIETGVVTYSNVPRDEKFDGSYNIERIQRRFWGWYHLSYLFWLSLHLFNYDIIYAQDVSAAGVPALIAREIANRRFFIRIGGDLLWERVFLAGKTKSSALEFYSKKEYKSYPFFWVHRFVIRRAEKIIVSADILFDIYTKYYGLSADRVVVVPNPVIQNIDTEDRAHECHSGKTILFAGRFVNYKNLDVLIEAFYEVSKNVPDARLLLIGAGPEKSNYEKLIFKLNIADKVEIIDAVSHNQIFSYIKESSLCVGPALTEFNPNFVLECVSAGKPILLSKENGLTIKLPDDFLFDSRSKNELAEKMEKLLRINPQMSSIVGELEEYAPSWDDIIDKHLSIFKS
ncbi:MAG: glycosyltransferase [Candidatus Paceibacterota bacterium]|jgi:glycosyltransferase involved in cell wall biosynthesis/putative flippase GtrA